MDQISVKHQEPVPVQQKIIQLDTLLVNEMKNKHLKNGKCRDAHQRLLHAAPAVTTDKIPIHGDDVRAELIVSTDDAAIKRNMDSERAIEIKKISSLFEVVGQENVPEAARLRALEAIERIVQERRDKLEIVSACSDRCHEKLNDSKKKVAEILERGSPTSVERTTFAELKRECDSFRADAIALRDEMESIRTELELLRQYLPPTHYADGANTSISLERDGMGYDERFNVCDHQVPCYQQGRRVSFENESSSARAWNIGENCSGGGDFDQKLNGYAREDAELKRGNHPYSGNVTTPYVSKGCTTDAHEPIIDKIARVAISSHSINSQPDPGAELQDGRPHEFCENRDLRESRNPISRRSRWQSTQYHNVPVSNSRPQPSFDRGVRRVTSRKFKRETHDGPPTWNVKREIEAHAELGNGNRPEDFGAIHSSSAGSPRHFT
jgi:hypothetical protein